MWPQINGRSVFQCWLTPHRVIRETPQGLGWISDLQYTAVCTLILNGNMLKATLWKYGTGFSVCITDSLLPWARSSCVCMCVCVCLFGCVCIQCLHAYSSGRGICGITDWTHGWVTLRLYPDTFRVQFKIGRNPNQISTSAVLLRLNLTFVFFSWTFLLDFVCLD